MFGKSKDLIPCHGTIMYRDGKGRLKTKKCKRKFASLAALERHWDSAHGGRGREI